MIFAVNAAGFGKIPLGVELATIGFLGAIAVCRVKRICQLVILTFGNASQRYSKTFQRPQFFFLEVTLQVRIKQFVMAEFISSNMGADLFQYRLIRVFTDS